MEDWDTVEGLWQTEERQGKGGGMHQDPGVGRGRLEIRVVPADDRGLFLCVTEPCLCPVGVRNAAVLGDRGPLCGPYVTPGCLGAAHSVEASNGTLPAGVKGEQKSSTSFPTHT